jgi:hypothetical protein
MLKSILSKQRNLIGLDIGGSLAKLAYFVEDESKLKNPVECEKLTKDSIRSNLTS